MALPAGDLRVLELELELRARAVVEDIRRELRAAGRMADLARRRIAELLPPALVVVVLRLVALRARAARLRFAERLGVAVVALDLLVRGAEVELGPLGVVE